MVHKPRKGAPAAAPGPQRPERPVVNCLCCGKVFRTRGDAPDVLHFLGTPNCRTRYALDTPVHVCVVLAAHEGCGKVFRMRGDAPDVLRFLGAPAAMHATAWTHQCM